MECLWDEALLQRAEQLPSELIEIIQRGSNDQYLNALTEASVNPRFTYILYAHCQPIFAHVCASLSQSGNIAASLAVIARVIPWAPYLSSYATHILRSHALDASISSRADEDTQILLSILRLLRFDARLFSGTINTTAISSFLSHQSKVIRYLAIRILQIRLEGADAWFETTLNAYIGPDHSHEPLDGMWDGRIIDYRFLTLWEDQRFEKIEQLLTSVIDAISVHQSWNRQQRFIPESLFHKSTALLGAMLLPKLDHNGEIESSPRARIVRSPSTTSNLNAIASALATRQPLLVRGLASSGKSALVQHAAACLCALDGMVTLHLNEQSDSKLLIGIESTGSSPGTFEWTPGVLTQAVQQGRWLLIEDLDKAPNEIISTLLALIERRELMIPSKKQVVRAHPSFRLIATIRTSLNHRNEEVLPLSNMLGLRRWAVVSIESPTVEEQAQIALSLFPTLDRLSPRLVQVYQHLIQLRSQPLSTGLRQLRVLKSLGLRDLLKWWSRISTLLRSQEKFTSGTVDNIFLEAMDCMIGAIPDSTQRDAMAAVIAEVLQLDPQRRDHLLLDRTPTFQMDTDIIKCGRYSLDCVPAKKSIIRNNLDFSISPHTCRMLERVSAAVVNREPLLLVGETGVGKTRTVQFLASCMGKSLVPFNLSQQSEVSDLMGGFKPISVRSLVIPLNDKFQDLFRSSFSQVKNSQFLDSLRKNLQKGNWRSVVKLWNEALKMVEQQRRLHSSRPPSPAQLPGEQPKKRRKLDSIDFGRWEEFALGLADVEKRLATGEKEGVEGFAFAFVEGKMIEAVRHGDWVLLDEINLASTDTLESLLGLLDPQSPSILLTEKGEVERIRAGEGFRIFAAMNPATDVGKKDLPDGIRSRFTEIYVESPDKDYKSLQDIVKAYLPQHIAPQTSIAADVATLHQQIVSLAEENKLVDGAGVKPHFSLRTLTRTLVFARELVAQGQCGILRALYEGFCMSFLTFLDFESERLVVPLIERSLFGKAARVQAELKKPLKRPERHDSEFVRPFPGSTHWIRKGSQSCEDQDEYIITPFIRKNLENLVRAASTSRFPVLIQGPTSSGKTSMIEYLAKRTGRKCIRINNHEFTDLQEYLGTYVSGNDGRLEFQEGMLVRALRDGAWIILDELNLAPTDVLEALNRLLDDNRELFIPETGKVIQPEDGFMLFATQNPAGLYGGRKTLSRAFRNRFLELHFDDIPIEELQTILHRRTQLPESRCRKIVQVYRELNLMRSEGRLFEQKSFATLRDLFRWAGRPNETIEQLASNGFMLLGERVRKDEERSILRDILERVMSANGPRVRIDETKLYSIDRPEIKAFTQRANDQHVVWTKAMRRLYVLTSQAIQNSEPVLLVGETGCGKTTVVQMLADALGQDLAIVNAHQNTETGDLIGSQRPVRNRATTEAELRTRILSAFASSDAHSTDLLGMPTSELIARYDEFLQRFAEDERGAYLDHTKISEIQALKVRHKALFEWADGSLVQSMRNGSLFLLDEISLADDSVLERINSVLEPSRRILLAEKGIPEGSSVEAAHSFQFFATMNPGGDYGKRELSPALRSRFTEIWVPPLVDIEDITQIVQAKLFTNAVQYSRMMVDFAAWFKDRFNTSASASTMSIRDALAWVGFINASKTLDTIVALVHGAAMVYIDTLGANPSGLIAMSGSNVQDERAACVGRLSELLDVEVASIYSAVPEVDIRDDEARVGPFSLPVRTFTVDDIKPPFSFEPSTTALNAMRVTRALQLLKPIMLEGDPGVGKTALVAAIAAACHVPLTRINMSEQTDLMDLFGSDAPVASGEPGIFAWKDAPFLRAMKRGEWVLLDEMNLASQSVLEGLNACLDHRGEVFVPELGMTFDRHRDFRLFAAQNPHHQGGGRKGLPASFVNRFTVVFADPFKSQDLMVISKQAFPQVRSHLIENAVTFVERLNNEVVQRRRFGTNGGPWEFNLRDVFRWLQLLASQDGLLAAATSTDQVDLLFVQRFRDEIDRNSVRALFAEIFRDVKPKADLVYSLSATSLQIGLGLLPRHKWAASFDFFLSRTSQPKRMLRSLQSMMICIMQKWPIVLCGPSGSGKTFLIESLAATIGSKVVTISLNADTDTMDLIGGYEQADARNMSSVARTRLEQRLADLAKKDLAGARYFEGTRTFRLLTSIGSERLNQVGLDSELADLPEDERTPLLDLYRTAYQRSVTVQKSRFQWVDGILVDAMHDGHWLVLDNANLCSASVLDRLNSLLEPNGSLMTNENAEDDGTPRLIRPHENFRIFLTLDPRYGELSRAMRNRAVELHIPEAPRRASAAVHLDSLRVESTLARFSHARGALHLDDSFQQGCQLLGVFEDHLTISDDLLVARFYRQLHAGLYGDILPGLLNANLAKRDLMPLDEHRSRLRAFYQTFVAQGSKSTDSTIAQILHPMSNQPLVQQSATALAQAYSLALSFESIQLAASTRAVLIALQENAPLLSRAIRLERQLQLSFGPTKANKGASAILDFLRNMNNEIITQVQNAEPAEEITIAKNFVGELYAACNIILDLLTTEESPKALLGAIFTVLNGALDRGKASKSRVASKLASAIQPRFQQFARQSLSNSAAVTFSLWQRLKPNVPRNVHELEAVKRLEELGCSLDRAIQQFRYPLDRLADLRCALNKTLSLAQEKPSEINRLTARIDNFLTTEQSGKAFTPHFTRVFSSLCTHLTTLQLGNQATFGDDEINKLEMLALRPVAAAFHERGRASAPRDTLHALSIISTTEWHEAFDNSDPTNTIKDLWSLRKVNLEQLNLLGVEIHALGKTVAKNSHWLATEKWKALDVILERLLRGVIFALQRGEVAQDIKASAHEIELRLSFRGGPPIQSSVYSSGKTRKSPIELLDRVAEYITSTPDSLARSQRAGRAWVDFGLAALMLYVPRVEFDPALKPRVEQDMYMRNRGRLGEELETLQSFNSSLTGESSSLRCRLLREQILEMGPQPAIDQVCRPNESQLSMLQSDFDGVLRMLQPILQLQYDDEFHDDAFNNLTLTRERLRSQYPAYSDYTGPIISFIGSLRIGWEINQSHRPVHINESSKQAFDALTPLCAAAPGSWFSDTLFLEVINDIPGRDGSLRWLSAVAARCTVLPLSTVCKELRLAIYNELYRVHEAWRRDLDQKQKQHASKSSLYRYQGHNISDDDATDETKELFPTYDDSEQPFSDIDASRRSIQIQASQIARIHGAIFNPAPIDSETITALLNESDFLWSCQLPLPASRLPTLLHALGSLSQKLNASENTPHYNIYMDKNVHEARNLVETIQRVMQKFRHLHKVWPEHATPVDVLRLCERILSYSFADPIMKYLPAVEKLHATIVDWQKVASREFSAAKDLEDVANLVISWRQLELSTWAGLFDKETRDWEASASEWWFVAFESIIAASISITDKSESLSDYSVSLVKILGDFLRTCGLGEYAARLRVLRNFEAHLRILTRDQPGLEIVHQGLANLVSYFGAFEPRVTASLSQRRMAIEKDVKDIVRIASWKDRNIEVLRQSAKGSHKKLAKAIRKYRLLLAEPVVTVLDNGIIATPGASPAIHITRGLEQSGKDQPSDDHSFHVKPWVERPKRFVNIMATSERITSLTQPTLDTFRASGTISIFLSELKADISELSRSTPRNLTEDNKGLVGHLKTRKRRLLADVLKQVRHMGFSSNLSQDVLSAQATLYKVMVLSPCLSHPCHWPTLQSASTILDKFLSILPKTRETHRQHSEDLTAAEVNRCVMNLESILSESITQRKRIANHMHTLNSLSQAVPKLESFCSSPNPRHDTGGLRQSPQLQNYPIQTLRAVVEATSKLTKIQSRLAEADWSFITQQLNGLAVKLETTRSSFEQMSLLPAGLVDDNVTDLQHRLSSTFDDMRSQTQTWIDQHPELEPVLSHVVLWIPVDNGAWPIESRIGSNPDPMAEDEWVSDILNCCDQMLASVERIAKKTQSDGPQKDTAWLVSEFNECSSILGHARVHDIVRSLSFLLESISRCQTAGNTNFSSLSALSAICMSVLPIFKAFQKSTEDIFLTLCALHQTTAELGFELATMYLLIAEKGFCTPSDKEATSDQRADEVESGTGLGDGEGAQDISKDIADDEDLSELAQEANQQRDGAGMEDSRDAVDMADDDLAGDEIDTQQEDDTEERDDISEKNEELEEEPGEVNDLDTSSLDEKLWNGERDETQRGKNASDANGQAEDEDLHASEANSAKSQSEDEMDNATSQQDTATQEAEQVDRGQTEDELDNHVDEQDKLDLPDDLDMSGAQEAQQGESDLETMSNDDIISNAMSETPLANEEDSDENPKENTHSMEEDHLDHGAHDTNEEVEDISKEEVNDWLQMSDEKDQADSGDEMAAERGTGTDAAQIAGESLGESLSQVDQNKELPESNKSAGLATNEDSDQGMGAEQQTQANQRADPKARDALQQLGDALETWYLQSQDISAPDEHPEERDDANRLHPGNDMRDAGFEHVLEGEETVVQALGAATAHQSMPLDTEMAIDIRDENDGPQAPLDSRLPEPEIKSREDSVDGHTLETAQESRRDDASRAFVGERAQQPDDTLSSSDSSPTTSEDVEEVDMKLTNTHISQDDNGLMSIQDAKKVWAQHESSTQNLALTLTEHLRLILEPTNATRMRGDFRTGKRLNIKRIIPYIASSFKRDKIWMRRSVASKRSYQIMLAIDDSQSMKESQSDDLAFETLALVARSLSMLEVGELCVVGFGETTNVAQDFTTTFSQEIAANVVRQFGFSQLRTNVRRLVGQSIEIFRTARLKASGTTSELWQLQLIISDGVCEDHPSIRQLVRQAREEHIMMVFIIVDNGSPQKGDTEKPKQSIFDLQTAEFSKDAQGDMQLKMVKYLDTFPFEYYLIVRDVQELPSVLAAALRQWFSEVNESSL